MNDVVSKAAALKVHSVKSQAMNYLISWLAMLAVNRAQNYTGIQSIDIAQRMISASFVKNVQSVVRAENCCVNRGFSRPHYWRELNPPADL
jgi:hypothetical protein